MPGGRAEGVQDSGQALDVVMTLVRLLRDTAAAGGLSLTDVRLLKRLAERVRTASDLAADLDLTAATVSVALDGLVRRGLVERRDPGDDRRSVPLAATSAGRAILDAARGRQIEALGALVAGLRPAERRALRVALSGLARVLSADRQP
jgi:DNA-binding MarR family transcriptional regulator